MVENGQLVPVKYPDPQRLSELPGYEKEREKVIANTKALLAGMPANNVLLYGDAGTGKSSAVKAIANEFAPEGLRLGEVKKNHAKVYLPELKFCGDNGAMIAAQGYYQYIAGHTAGLELNGLPTLPIDYE